MEAGLVALYVFIIILILAALAIGGYAAIKAIQAQGNTPFTPPPCSQSASNLRDISNLQCCVINGNNTSFIYDRVTNLTLAPAPTPYLQVCQGFCPNGDYNPTTMQCTSGNTTAFNNCVQLLKPQQCLGEALPIAIANGILYYGYQAGNGNCTQCCPCNEPTLRCTISNCF